MTADCARIFAKISYDISVEALPKERVGFDGGANDQINH